MDPIEVVVGYVVLKHGNAVRTGAGNHRISKLYQTIGPAKAVANSHGGLVYQARVTLGVPSYIPPTKEPVPVARAKTNPFAWS